MWFLRLFTGSLLSYPPNFSMCTVVTSLNGTQITLEGTVNVFDVYYFHIDNKIPYQCDEHHYGCLCQFDLGEKSMKTSDELSIHEQIIKEHLEQWVADVNKKAELEQRLQKAFVNSPSHTKSLGGL